MDLLLPSIQVLNHTRNLRITTKNKKLTLLLSRCSVYNQSPAMDHLHHHMHHHHHHHLIANQSHRASANQHNQNQVTDSSPSVHLLLHQNPIMASHLSNPSVNHLLQHTVNNHQVHTAHQLQNRSVSHLHTVNKLLRVLGNHRQVTMHRLQNHLTVNQLLRALLSHQLHQVTVHQLQNRSVSHLHRRTSSQLLQTSDSLKVTMHQLRNRSVSQLLLLIANRNHPSTVNLQQLQASLHHRRRRHRLQLTAIHTLLKSSRNQRMEDTDSSQHRSRFLHLHLVMVALKALLLLLLLVQVVMDSKNLRSNHNHNLTSHRVTERQ